MKTRAWLPVSLATVLMFMAGAQPLRFTVAIVRLDGRLVPFAAYDDGRWQRAWPEADEKTDGTPTIDNTPSIWRRRGEAVPSTWYVWPASGTRPIEVRVDVKGVEVVDAHCGAQIALATDLPAAKGEHPLKFGLAVDANLPIGSVEEVQRSDVLWKSAQRVLIGNFDRLEAAKAQADGDQLVRESPAPLPQITALHRQSKFARSPMYFIAKRQYRTPRSPQDPGCGALTIMTGWLMPNEAGIMTLRDAKVFLTDCDAKEARTGLPLGALHVSNQLFWVIQEHGYEDETYVIAEIGPTEVRYPLEVNGGGC